MCMWIHRQRHSHAFQSSEMGSERPTMDKWKWAAALRTVHGSGPECQDEGPCRCTSNTPGALQCGATHFTGKRHSKLKKTYLSMTYWRLVRNNLLFLKCSPRIILFSIFMLGIWDLGSLLAPRLIAWINGSILAPRDKLEEAVLSFVWQTIQCLWIWHISHT